MMLYVKWPEIGVVCQSTEKYAFIISTTVQSSLKTTK